MSNVICTNCSAEMPLGYHFCGYCGTALQMNTARGATPIRDDLRDVTILFADLSGFTALSEQLSPEQVRDLMDACFEGLGGIVTAHGGHIDKYIGDSIMALFGAPTSHEDDPIRAAEAALAMRAFMVTFSSNTPATGSIGLRIGLNCGTVFAGAMGASTRRDYSVLGDAVNLASRLESAALPGTILSSADFKRRVETSFSFGPKRFLKLKGKTRAVEAYELHNERFPSDPRQRLDGLPFVGRQRELEVLTRLLNERTSNPRWIEIRGPVGMGKTRLAEEALTRTPSVRPIVVLSRTTTGSRPFELMRRLLQAIWREVAGEPQRPISREAFVEALQPLIGPRDRTIDAIWYVAAPDGQKPPVTEPDTLTFRLTIESGVIALLTALPQKYVLFLDSFDQADNDTRSVLEHAYKASAQRLPPIITTVRGEALSSRPATHLTELGALDDMTALQLVQALRGATDIALQTQRDIVTRASGVPLFIAELVRTICESLSDAQSAPSETKATEQSLIPSSLLGVMVARLDRLDPIARRFLAFCSIQGQDFTVNVSTRAWSLMTGENVDIEPILVTLSERQIIAVAKDEPQRWSFTQVLLQNACYEQLLQRDRRQLHRTVAAAMLAEAGTAQPAAPETLAHHYECAEQWLEAAHQNVRAGDRAAELFANNEALTRYARALRAIEECAQPDSVEARDIARSAHRSAAVVSLRIGDYPAAQSHAEQMLALSEQPNQHAEAIRLQAAAITPSGDLSLSAELLSQASARLANEPLDLSNRGVQRDITIDRAEVAFLRGRNDEAANHILSVRQMPDPSNAERIRIDILEGRIAHAGGRFDDAARLYADAYDAATLCGSLSEEAAAANYMGNAARDAGRYDDAESSFLRALEVWTQTGKTESIAGAHNNLANLAMSRGDEADARRHYGEALATFKAIGNTAGSAIALMNLAILANECGEPDNAIAYANEALGHLHRSGNQSFIGVATVIKGEAQLEAGLVLQARETFTAITTDATLTVQPLAIAGAHRGLGRVALALGDIKTARHSLVQAVSQYAALRRVQEEARTKLYLAQALNRDGRLDEAAASLQSARQTFREIGAQRDLERSSSIVIGPSAQ